MHWFENKFAAFGRALDHVVERMRERRPGRYKRKAGPTVRERAGEWLREARTSLATGRWKDRAQVGPETRKRLIVLGSALGVCLAAAGGYRLFRPGPPRLSEQEIMDLAMIKARIEVGGTAGGGVVSDRPFGAFGAGPAPAGTAGAAIPAPAAVPKPIAPAASRMPLPR